VATIAIVYSVFVAWIMLGPYLPIWSQADFYEVRYLPSSCLALGSRGGVQRQLIVVHGHMSDGGEDEEEALADYEASELLLAE